MNIVFMGTPDFARGVLQSIYDSGKHNVYAGADVLLMPSKFEPCGIAQMMAMHYGTLPLVRSTGGLRDTVHDYKPNSLIANGFVFKNYNIKEYNHALDRVFDV